MINRSDAYTLLNSIVKEEHKISHAIHVAEMMESIAGQFQIAGETWYLTGLLHDIDIPSINGDWTRHGIVAQAMLAGLLPPHAMKAIKAHDRNAGVFSDTKISQSLRLADVVDNLSHHVPFEQLRQAMKEQNFEELRHKLPNDLLNLKVMEDFAHRWPEIGI